MVDRDTDADWRLIGERDPFWGVLTHDRFRSENFDAVAREAFYASGEGDIAQTCARAAGALGGFPTVESALDFGCGAGRLTRAMACRAGRVTGVDVSPGMLAVASVSAPDNVRFTHDLPDGPFDWINSQIVFQHIDPRRGMVLLDQRLARLGSSGMVTLQFTLHRDAPPAPERPWWRTQVSALRHRLTHRSPPAGAISMYDYDLGLLMQALNRRGVLDVALFHTVHGIHHGALIIGRREGALSP